MRRAPVPRLEAGVEQVGEHPSVPRVACRVEERQPDVAVVRHVQRRPPRPGVAVVDRHEHLGSVAADRRREVAPQARARTRSRRRGGRRGTRPCRRRRRPRCGAPPRRAIGRGLGGVHPVDAGLAARDEQVGDRASLARSTARPRSPCRTRGRRDGRRRRARAASRRETARAVPRRSRARVGLRSERVRCREHRTDAVLEVLERQRVVVGVEGDLVPLVGELRRELEPRLALVLLAERSGRRRSGGSSAGPGSPGARGSSRTPRRARTA